MESSTGPVYRFLLFVSPLILADLALMLDVPFVRPVIWFLVLTFLPGYLMLRILNLLDLEYTLKFVLCVGMSLSFTMLFGLLLNSVGVFIGEKAPLNLAALLLSFNSAYVLLAASGWKSGERLGFSMPSFEFSILEKIFMIPLALFLLLSVYGIYSMNTSGNDSFLILLYASIPVYLLLLCVCNKSLSNRIYPVALFFISLALILLLSMRSDHIIGVDAHLEYYYFQTTLGNHLWSDFGKSTLDACLSISLLPSVYQSFLNVPPEFLFKILYSLIYSVSPLVIYLLSKKYLGEFYGFLASVFFIFQQDFLWTAFNPRTNTAILFFSLSMMMLFNDEINSLKRRALFILFMVSVVVSHYSTAYIFLLLLLFVLLGSGMFGRDVSRKRISFSMVFLFLVLIVFWYSYVTEAAFTSGVLFMENTVVNLNNFFIEESRGGGVPSLLGSGIAEKGLPHKIEFFLTWTTFALIGIGVMALIVNHKKAFSLDPKDKIFFLKNKFETEYLLFVLACSCMLVTMVALPFVSRGYDIQRLYAMQLTILSVFFVIGGIVLSKYLRIPAYLVLLLVLAPYFLSLTGVTYQASGYNRSIILNSRGEDQYDAYYVHDSESSGAKWLKEHVRPAEMIYSDLFGPGRLISQGMIRDGFYSPELVEKNQTLTRGYIYLRWANVVEGLMLDPDYRWHKVSDNPSLPLKNLVYANGGSEVLM